MPVLHLGVIDLPYVTAPKRRQRKASAGTKTTGDVAGWLENKYHPMEIYYETHKQDIFAAEIEKSLEGALESIMLGAPPTLDPFGSATSAIEDGFKKFLTNKEMETLGYPGVPTQAAIEGINHRLKLRRGPRRPSFVDTGLYLASSKAWVD